MKYFVRLNGNPPFHGPYDEREIEERIRSGEFAGRMEAIEAAGQSESQLAAAGGWRDLSGAIGWRAWSDELEASRARGKAAVRKRRYLQEVRATTCYPRLRVLIAGLTGFAMVIEVTATVSSISSFAFIAREEGGARLSMATPALVVIAVCTIELLFTIALYGLVRTVVDLADLSLHRDTGVAAT